jgi:hypothetical protein
MLPSNVPWRQKFDYLTPAAQKENPACYAARQKAAS